MRALPVDSREISVEGFKEKDGQFVPASLCSEEDWDSVRSRFVEHIQGLQEVKEEPDSSDEGQTTDRQIIEYQ